MSNIYNIQGNKKDKLYMEYSSTIEEERELIEKVQAVQSTVDGLFKEATELITRKLGYGIDLEPLAKEGRNKGTQMRLMVNANIFPRTGRLGHYSAKGVIEINYNLIKEYHDYISGLTLPGQVKGEELYNNIIRTLVHEIGHRIHHTHWDYKTVRLPREGKTEYAKKNNKENFAEAFENLIMDEDQVRRFGIRSQAIRKVLDNQFNETQVIIAAKNTIPERRKSLITLDQICEEVGMTTKSARVKLRKSGEFKKGESGWAWSPDDTNTIKEVKAYLKGGK